MPARGKDVVTELGRRWHLLSSQDKGKYEEMFENNMKKYRVDMSTYKPSEEFLSKVRLWEEKEEEIDHAGNHPPGMMKAYFNFVSSTWMRVAMSNPDMSVRELQRELWQEWSGETEEVLAPKPKSRKRPKAQFVGALTKQATTTIAVKEEEVDISSDPNPSMADDESSPKKLLLQSQLYSDGHPQSAEEERELKAFAFFQTQMKGELLRVCPDQLSDGDMDRIVRGKWAELTEERKDVFFREVSHVKYEG